MNVRIDDVGTLHSNLDAAIVAGTEGAFQPKWFGPHVGNERQCRNGDRKLGHRLNSPIGPQNTEISSEPPF